MIMAPGTSVDMYYDFFCLYFIFEYSEAPPETDESNVGNRDKRLMHTYKGLVNIRSAFTLSSFLTC
jgi:hypothetical protein